MTLDVIMHQATSDDVFKRAHPLATPPSSSMLAPGAGRQQQPLRLRMAIANVLTLHAGARPRGQPYQPVRPKDEGTG
eukprot:15434500-Alexandrium_andersonii.AAC.1